jgi:4-amino-4-deoxy-L-arabinose transferase-like glycosyltransferase
MVHQTLARPARVLRGPQSADLVPLPVLTVTLVAGAQLAVHLLTNGQYGYHRDELYYLDAGQHPAFGYVDYPPLTPLLAAASSLVFGNAPWILRLLPSVVGAAMVVLAALIAREMGAGRKAQVLAAIAAATNLLLLGSNWLFMTVTFDQLWWMATIYVFVRLSRTGERRLWLLIGALLGIGLETKLTIAGLAIGLAVAVLSTGLRRQLREPWPWTAAAIAFAIFLPNMVWQQLNGWPTLDFLRAHSSVIQAAGEQAPSINFDSGGIFAFVAFQPLLIGIVTLPLWVIGWYYLFRRAEQRPVGIAALVAFLLFMVVGKAYYPGPLIPVVLAAGCVQLEQVAVRRPWTSALRSAAWAMIVQAIVASPITLPVVPQPYLAQFHLDDVRKDFADTVGWPQMVDQVTAAYQQLDPAERESAVILAANYGEAGAIDLYGPARGLPRAISPYLTYWYWKPAHVDAATTITVGFSETGMRRLFRDVTVVGAIASVDNVHNEEVGRPILVCRGPLVPLDEAWPQLRNFF